MNKCIVIGKDLPEAIRHTRRQRNREVIIESDLTTHSVSYESLFESDCSPYQSNFAFDSKYASTYDH